MSRIIVPRAPGHFLRLRHAAFGPALRLRAHVVHAPGGRRSPRSSASTPSWSRRDKALEESGVRFARTTIAYAADMRYVGQEHPVTVDLSSAVFKKPRRDQAPLRRGAPCALRHQRPRGARRDRQPAGHGDRAAEEAAPGEDLARRATPSSAGGARETCSLTTGKPRPRLCPYGAQGGQPHRRAGTRRGARIDDGAPARGPHEGGRLEIW